MSIDQGGAGHSRRGGVLREAYELPGFSRMDPVDGQWLDPAFSAVYETLVVWTPEHGVEPALASSLSADGEGLSWTLKLPGERHFHSGAACDADAVVRVLNAVRDPVDGVNAELWAPVRAIAAVDATTVRIDLHHPYANLPNALRSYHSAILNPASRREFGKAYGEGIVDATGPFRLTRWESSVVEAQRWDAYPGSNAAGAYRNHGVAHLDAVRWHSIPEGNARVEALERGDVDCVRALPTSLIDRVADHPDLVVGTAEEAAGYYLAVNFERTDLHFDDLRVRRALSHAIDRRELVKRVFDGHAAPGYGPAGPGYVFYEPAVERTNGFDPALSGRLLDEAGLPADADGSRIGCEAMAPDWPEMRLCTSTIAGMLRQVGVELRFSYVDPARFFYDLGSHPAAFVSRWLWPDQLDAITVFTASSARPAPNWQLATVPELDRAYDTFNRAADVDEMHRAAARAQLLVAEQLPLIPLLTPHAVWAHHKRVRGWQPQGPNLYHAYHDVWIDHELHG